MTQPVYIENLTVVIRGTTQERSDETTSALVGALEIGDEFPLDDLFEDLQEWLVRSELEPFEVETRRSIAQVGATGVGTQIIVWFLSAGGAIALHDAWEYLKKRVPRGEEAVRREFDWLRQLPVAERPSYLANSLAQALDARRAEIRLETFSETADEMVGTFTMSTGERYVVRATPENYLINLAAGNETGGQTRETTETAPAERGVQSSTQTRRRPTHL